ncbi:MAG: GntR family transcriptional regulator [Pseudomonadota bacterium]
MDTPPSRRRTAAPPATGPGAVRARAGASAVEAARQPARIMQALAARIVAGQLPPGARITETAVASEFGTSHAPVREALRMLERAGLVEIAPYRGARVREQSVREVTELYEVRAALVGLRARWIARDARRAEFARRLAPQVDQLARLASGGDAAAYAEAALAVNRAFTESVANPWLRGMLESLSMQTARYTRLAMTGRARRMASARAWAALLAAVASGQAARAERIARANSLETRDATVRALQARCRSTNDQSTSAPKPGPAGGRT